MCRSLHLFSWALTCILLAACGSGEKTDTAAIRVSCLGSACSSGGVESYVNTAAQVWTYHNTGDVPVSLDLNFSNLAQGQELAYVFGNGYSTAINSQPNPGQASSTDGSAGKTTVGSSTQAELVMRNALLEGHDEWRKEQQGREAELSRWVRSTFTASAAQGTAPASSALNNYAVMSTSVFRSPRDWVDNSSAQAKSYPTSVRSSCDVGNGRQVVIWADDSAVTRNIISKASIAALESTLCGSSGAVSRMSQLIGNVWGTNTPTHMLQELGDALQDINVVVISAGKDQPWAGYFSGRDTFLKTYRPDSNEALAFYINADQMENHLAYTQSVLIHELTHMVYWFERTVSRGALQNETWLDEMAALMSEDILTPLLVSDADGSSYQPTLTYRLPAFLNSGGGLNLLAWASIDKASPYYSMAAAFGAYLNRQYGLAIYKDLVTECTSISSSWSCLDVVIKKNGGKGVEEAFNHFGLAVFGLGSRKAPSSMFSFPARMDEGYLLSGIDLVGLSQYRPLKSPSVTNWSTGTLSYFVETTNISIFSFTRRGITVPPRSRLNIMIRQGSGA